MPSAKGPLHSGVATCLLRDRRGEGGVGRPRERQIPSLSLSATSVVTVRARELQDEYERQGRRWPPPALPSLHAHARHGLPPLRPPPSSLNDCARLSLNSVPGVAPPKEHLLRNAGVTAVAAAASEGGADEGPRKEQQEAPRARPRRQAGARREGKPGHRVRSEDESSDGLLLPTVSCPRDPASSPPSPARGVTRRREPLHLPN